ncbi:MAG TPA: hypothetical protein VMR41_02035 [Patescibacteria group bacterium]|nr:hypothetical protein [Patescibacteria group bacterium]
MKDQQPGRENEALLSGAAKALEGLYQGIHLGRTADLSREEIAFIRSSVEHRWKSIHRLYLQFDPQFSEIQQMFSFIDESIERDNERRIILMMVGNEFSNVNDQLAAAFLGDILYSRTFNRGINAIHDASSADAVWKERDAIQTELGLSGDWTGKQAEEVTFQNVARGILLGKVRLTAPKPQP